AVARERAPDRRLPATDPHDPQLARPSARWPLGAPPLPGLPSDLVRVLGSRARVEAALEPAKLALKLAPAVETLPRERSAPTRLADCAAGLALVRAIAEATGRGQRGHVLEGLVEPLGDVPELQLAQARRIEHQPAIGERQQLSVARGVATPSVAADLVRRHHRSPGK